MGVWNFRVVFLLLLLLLLVAVVVRWLLFAGFLLFAVLLASLLLLSVVCFMSIGSISWKFGIPFHRLLASFRHLFGFHFAVDSEVLRIYIFCFNRDNFSLAMFLLSSWLAPCML